MESCDPGTKAPYYQPQENAKGLEAMTKKPMKMLGARVSESAIMKLKTYARALGRTDADTVEFLINNYSPSPALQKAISALEAADRAVAAAAKDSKR